MSNELTINSQQNADINNPHITIIIKGELNAQTASIFESDVKNIFLKKPQDIYLDMSHVTVFVSAAIGSLLLLQDFVSQKKYKFIVIATNQKVKEILTLTGLDSIMEI